MHNTIMINKWIIFAVAAGFASNLFNFFNRFLLKEQEDTIIYAWYFEALRCIIFCLIALFDWKIVITSYSLFLFILIGITEFIAGYVYMKMHAYSHLSISTILSRARVIWIPLIAYLLIRENLKISEYIGILILFCGLSITVSPHKLFFNKGARYASVAAFVIALNTVLTNMALPFGSNSVLNIITVLPATFLYPFFIPQAYRRIKKFTKKNFLLKSFAIVINVLSIYLFLFALRMGEVSKVNAIYQGMMVFSILAGIFILKEKKDILKKILGTVITIIGVLLLSR